MRILITLPNMKLPGGVTGLYKVLDLDNKLGVRYFEVNYFKNSNSVFTLCIIYFRFIIIVNQHDVVHINPSFDRKSFLRDGLFVIIAKFFGKKTLVYWHGWQNNYFDKVVKSKLLTKYYNLTFNNANYQVVLANQFADSLRLLGYKAKITLESNAVNNIVNFENLNPDLFKPNELHLVYMSRIVAFKGWDIAIDTMDILNKRGYSNIYLNFCGDGSQFEQAKDKIKKLNLINVNILGYLDGTIKYDVLKNSDICFFPTRYPEGMPMTILEAVIYGMPVITRSEGGIKDHLEDGVNGYILDSEKPEDFADIIIKLFKDKELYNNIRENNLKLGQEKFTKEQFIKRLFGYYAEMVS